GDWRPHRAGGSRDELELLDHDLGLAVNGLPAAAKDVEVHPKPFVAGGRHSGREDMLGYRRGLAARPRAAHSPERGTSGFPAQRVREYARRGLEPDHVARRVERLQHVLRVLRGGAVAPPADLDRDLAVVLLLGHAVPREDAEDDRGLEMRDVAYDEAVRPVPEPSREADLGAR